MKHNSAPGLVVAIGRPAGQENDTSPKTQVASPNTDLVPLDALAMPDDQEQMQPPAVGDEVNYQVTGKVAAIEGNLARVQRTSINGQDLPDGKDDEDHDASPEHPDGGADAHEAKGLRDQAAGLGMMMSIVLLVSLFFGTPASAQNTTVIGSAALTNSLVVATAPAKLYALTGYNSSASTEYVQIFMQGSIPTNGVVPLFSIPVAATQFYSFDFSYYGADLDSITVASSSTAATLTLTGAQTSFQAITKSR